MSIEIVKELCVGCGQCAGVCPGSLLKVRDGIACMKYPQNCWGCASCMKECKFGALRLYLGRDIGGLGGKLSCTYEGVLLHWTAQMPGGSRRTITIDSRNSNQY